MSKHFTKKDTQMANKHKKTYSASLIIWEVHSNHNTNPHYKPQDGL